MSVILLNCLMKSGDCYKFYILIRINLKKKVIPKLIQIRSK